MELINRYARTFVMEVISGGDTDEWMVSMVHDVDGTDLRVSVQIRGSLRDKLAGVKPGDRIRGTLTRAQYLTEDGALVQRCRLSSAKRFEAQC